uniref:Uncharacterized protein n=1 Tax=Arion vulgaris TaxID=1028688 RepID=A0A0B7AAR6_9EUPU
MASRRIPTDERGTILVRHEGEYSCNNYEDFRRILGEYTNIEDNITRSIPAAVINNTIPETFTQLVLNFQSKENLIHQCSCDLSTKINELEDEISMETGVKNRYSTKLKKLEVGKLETFKWVLQQELKREVLNKEKALKKFMAQCVNNDLAPEIADAQ